MLFCVTFELVIGSGNVALNVDCFDAKLHKYIHDQKLSLLSCVGLSEA